MTRRRGDIVIAMALAMAMAVFGFFASVFELAMVHGGGNVVLHIDAANEGWAETVALAAGEALSVAALMIWAARGRAASASVRAAVQAPAATSPSAR